MSTGSTSILALAVVLGSELTSTVFAQEFPPSIPAAKISATDVRRASTPPSVDARRHSSGHWICTFEFKPPQGAESVSLAGDFNGWNPRETPMQGNANGVWTKSIKLSEGTHYYKFVVDGSRWFHDPWNPDRSNDGHGGFNSIVRLGAEATLDPEGARIGDGRIEAAGLAHHPELPLYRQSLTDGRTLLRYRTLRNDVQDVEILVEKGGSISMGKVTSNDRFDFWEALLPSELPQSRYTFILTDGEQHVSDPEIYSLEGENAPTVRTPDWAKDAIWYQIMVDRFRNGVESNDPSPVRPWKSEWYSSSPWEGRDGQTFYEWFVFDRLYGGDFQGLKQKLDYLQELGVNALYLNPVFQAESCHKYNTTNYLHIDERYGAGNDYVKMEGEENLLDPTTWKWNDSDRIFIEFIRIVKSRGFRIIIDGVFNHVGTQHPAFRDVLENKQDSAFADWFDVKSWDPFEYEGWAGFGSLPVFKKSKDGIASDAVKQHIFEVTRRWMDPDGDGDPSDGIDGWRLDVPNEIAIPFWIEWCAHVRSINPDAYISGEIWDRADEWLDGKSFDAVMNYEFSKVAFDWIGARKNKITPTEADRRLAELRIAYPAEVTYVLQNLVDSHDTDRAVSKIHNPDRPFDSENREQDDPNYDGSKPPEDAYRRLRLLALLQMTYVGAPMVYYGDEVGIWGSDDPNNRKPMLWQDLQPYDAGEENHVSEELLAYYKDAIALRNNHEALRRGSFQTTLLDDDKDVWSFIRATDNEEVLVALNASENDAKITLPEGDWKPIFGKSGNDDDSGVLIEQISGRAWLKTK